MKGKLQANNASSDMPKEKRLEMLPLPEGLRLSRPARAASCCRDSGRSAALDMPVLASVCYLSGDCGGSIRSAPKARGFWVRFERGEGGGGGRKVLCERRLQGP